MSGTVSEAGIKRVGGDPGKALPEGWQEIDPKTGAPVGISKGWDYAPGASVAEDIIALAHRKIEQVPALIGADLGTSIVGLIDQAWPRWLAEARTEPDHSAGLAGALSVEVIAALQGRGIAPASAEILVSPGLLRGPKADRHKAKGDHLSDDEWQSLPSALRKPQLVLLDTESGRLIYILGSEGVTPQLAVRLDYWQRTRGGRKVANMIVSAYRVDMADIRRRIKSGALQFLDGRTE